MPRRRRPKNKYIAVSDDLDAALDRLEGLIESGSIVGQTRVVVGIGKSAFYGRFQAQGYHPRGGGRFVPGRDFVTPARDAGQREIERLMIPALDKGPREVSKAMLEDAKIVQRTEIAGAPTRSGNLRRNIIVTVGGRTPRVGSGRFHAPRARR